MIRFRVVDEPTCSAKLRKVAARVLRRVHPCVVCGKASAVRHHVSWLPKQVIAFLCRKCHMAWHRYKFSIMPHRLIVIPNPPHFIEFEDGSRGLIFHPTPLWGRNMVKDFERKWLVKVSHPLAS